MCICYVRGGSLSPYGKKIRLIADTTRGTACGRAGTRLYARSPVKSRLPSTKGGKENIRDMPLFGRKSGEAPGPDPTTLSRSMTYARTAADLSPRRTAACSATIIVPLSAKMSVLMPSGMEDPAPAGRSAFHPDADLALDSCHFISPFPGIQPAQLFSKQYFFSSFLHNAQQRLPLSI